MRLTKRPAPGESVVLNVTHTAGDAGIKLVEGDRLVFDENNWDRTAWLYYDIDHKIKQPTTAGFDGASGNIPMAWLVVFAVLSAFFLAVATYHSWALPHPASDSREHGARRSSADIFREFFETFRSFFAKKQIWVAVAFMLLYRLPEAQLVKLINPFLLDPIDKGGLGLSTGEVGFVYGTVGLIASP